MIKKTLYKMSQCFPKPFRRFGGNTNVKFDLSIYTTKTVLKSVTHVDTSNFALKTNLGNLKTKADKLDIGKLVPVPTDLSKLSNIVKKTIKKTVYDKLVAKVNTIDISGYVLKTKYDADKTELEKKFLIAASLLKNQIILLKLVNKKIKYQVLVA